MTLLETIDSIFSKKASSPAQRAVNAGAPDAAENPTEGQRRAGNYRKVHLSIDGFRVSIENPKGSIRSGVSPDGTRWSNALACDYGDIRGTTDTDGDPVDIYLSDHPEKGCVFVIDQVDPKTGKFDEHKVMYGFDSVEDAKKTYLACYQKGWNGLGWITPVSKAEFRKWIDSSDRKTKPFHEYRSVAPIVDPIKVNEKAAQVNPVNRPSEYVVQKGDSLYGIAQKLKVPLKELIAANSLKNPNVLSIGQKIVIPPPKQAAGPVDVYERFNNVAKRLHENLNNPILEAAVLANIDRETGGRFDYATKQMGGGGGRGLFQYTGPSLDAYKAWLAKNGLQDSSDSQIDYFTKVYMPSRSGYKAHMAAGAEFTADKYADWLLRKVFTPAHTIPGNRSYSEAAVAKSAKLHSDFMKRLRRNGDVWVLNQEASNPAKTEKQAPADKAPAAKSDPAEKKSIVKTSQDRHEEDDIPAEMKEKFPIGKWVTFPHARMSGKVRKIVGYYYGGKRSNGKDYYCCWLDSPDIEEGGRFKTTGLAMYGGFGDHPGKVFNTREEAQKNLDDEETASGYKKEKSIVKTSQADDADDPMEGVPPGVRLRGFTDAPATRQAIMDNVLEAVKNRFPIENDDVRLELLDVKYEGPTSYTLEQQKRAILNNRRLGCSVAGTWRLTDKRTGKVLDERRDGVIRVPYYTDRGTIINNGSEYTVISQARLSPGVYVRRKQNGELESQFNVANGLGFRIGLDRSTGALNMSVGQGHVPLYPILSALGVSDDDMRKSWGDAVANVNIAKFDPRAVDKVYARYAGRRADMSLTPSEKASFISESLASSGLDPDVVVRTLGLENASGVTGKVMLRAAQKLLNINRGAEEPDERDNPRFSRFYGVEDMMRERIDRDSGRLTKSLLFRAKRDRSLARIARNALGPYLDTFLSGSGLAMPGEEANPMSLLTQQSRITRLGEGGISSPDLVTNEARNVQGDYLGYVDFISGPESFGIGIDVRAALGTMKGSDNRIYNKMIDMRTGKTRYVSLNDASSHTVAFPGQDPKSPNLYVMRKGVPTMVPRDEVDFMVPGFGNTVSAGINMNPMPTAVMGARQFYMSKFWEQFLPQKEGEVPLVESLTDDGKTTYGEYYGRRVGCLTAPFAGTVVKVSDNEIVLRGKDGREHTASLVKGLPFNRLSSLSFTAQVKKGDEVEEGGILANSNFTDPKTGTVTMGRNLKVAVLPAPQGTSSFEDAIVISESAAKKLATSRTYNFEQDTKNGVQIARSKFLAAFPSAYTKAQADTIGDDGVVKVGTVLHRDDPMILAIGPKMLSPENAQLGKLSGVLRNAITDRSQKWEHDWPGVVTDIVSGPHGAKVIVNSDPPVKPGDKLCPDFSLKGVVSDVIPDDKMPRDAATNEPYDMLMNPMGFLSRVAPGQIALMNLAKVAKKTGKQIRIPQLPPQEGWTAWVKRQMDENGVKESSDVFDPQTGRIIKNVGDGYAYVKAFHHLAEKKFSARGVDSAYTMDEQPAKGGDDGAKRMCFTADQPIRVLHGEESIGHIVDKKIPEYVWTRFDNGSWGYSLITNWFCRKGKMSEVLSISINYLPGSDNCSRKRVVYTGKTMHVTRQHHMYSFNKGEVLAGDLRPGDWLTTYGYVPTEDQMSILMGSMLGDGCICNINDNLCKSDRTNSLDVGCIPFYQEQHSHHQYAYVNWKIHCLGALVSSRKNTQRKSKTGFRRADGDDSHIVYFQIHRHDIAERLKNMFYRQPDGSLGRKSLVNVDLSNINDVGIAAWFLDDGCASEHTKNGVPTGSPFGAISTLNFTYEENCRLAEWLCGRLGAGVTVRTTHKTYKGVKKEYYYLGLSADACRSMARIVAKYIRPEDIPASKKWLINEVSRLYETYVGVDTAYALGSVPALVTSVRPYSDGKHGPDDEICLYDITVAKSHKYCASDCLVSNSGFDATALLSHGATDVLKDSITLRGSRNDEYWRRYRLGLPVEEPGVPFIYQKFLNTLRAGGVNVVEKGDVTSIMPQTDKDIDELAQGRVIDSSQMVDPDMNPVRGGLFDLGKTGGMGGNRWSMITLPDPVPNPMMEEPVRRVLGLTAKKMEAVLSGREELNGKTGGEALREALSKVDVDGAIEKARSEVLTRRGAQRDNAVKVLGYLKSANKMGISPSDWMISRVPVLPPMFRPVSKMGDVALVPDMNELYKELIEMKRNYEDLSRELPASALADERLAVYGAVKAAYGLGDPVTQEGRAKNLKGAVRQVIGTVPKMGMFQAKTVSKTQDLVGRSVITPNGNLSMDQIGIPEDMAWTIFRPFVERKLVQRGYSPVASKEMIDERNATARHILDDVMEERPVLMDRAPTWHKFNIMAFKPHIVKGRSINVCPLVCGAFNADFDGDQQIGSVRVSLTGKALDDFLSSKDIGCINLKFLINYHASNQKRSLGDADQKERGG